MMTADDAGVNVRERLAQLVLDALKVQEDADPLMYVGDQSRDDKPLSAVILDGFFSLTALADAILAAGFGDVAGVKAAAWTEGYVAGFSDPDFEAFNNPYRTTDTDETAK